MPKPKIEIDRRDKFCPQTKKQCKKHWEECAWAIEKDREFSDGTIVNLKCCGIYLNADEHENSNNRLAMLQKEMGEVKNVAIFQAGTILDHVQSKNELQKLIVKHIETPQKLIGDTK